MLDTMTSNKIKPFVNKLGSSSTDGEEKGFLCLLLFDIPKGYFPKGRYLPFDIASHSQNVLPHFESETFKDIETIPVEMLEHDIFIKMPPKKKYTIKARIARIRKAKPRIVIPENPYTGI